MKINKLSICLSFLTVSILSGCATQNIASIEDRSSNFYGRNARIPTNNPTPEFFNESSRSSSEITVKPLSPLDNNNESPKNEAGQTRYVLERTEAISTEKKVDEKVIQKDQYQSNTHIDDSSDDLTHEPEVQVEINKEVQVSVTTFSVKNPLNNPNYIWPVHGEVTSRFGKMGNKFNEGINISAPAGTIVNSSADGKVIYVGKKIEGYGNLMIIKHDGNIMTAYAHLNDLLVQKGAEVKKGESIATVGTSGGVEKPQLHFSIRSGKKTIDPEKSIN